LGGSTVIAVIVGVAVFAETGVGVGCGVRVDVGGIGGEYVAVFVSGCVRVAVIADVDVGVAVRVGKEAAKSAVITSASPTGELLEAEDAPTRPTPRASPARSAAQSNSKPLAVTGPIWP